jgi:outer membrane protein, heavy metal efflux system
MMEEGRAAWARGLAVLLFAGCAAVDPTTRWQRVGELAGPATGATLTWEQSDEDAAKIRATVRDLEADGLSRDEAIRIALLNSRGLQATFEDVGIAEARVVQAGLFTNPSLAAILAFPLDLGNASITLMGFLSDLWIVPAEEAIAEVQAEATLRRVAAEVVATAAAAADAYDEAVYWSSRRALAAEAEADPERGDPEPETDRERWEARGDELERDRANALVDKKLALARNALATLLAFPDPDELPQLTDGLEPPTAGGPGGDEAVAFALDHRFDVATAELAVESASREVDLEHLRVYGQVALGPAYAGGFGQFDSGGPAFGFDLPIFDQNQAQIARAEYALRSRRKGLEDAVLEARSEVRTALAEAEFRRREAEVSRARLAEAVKLRRKHSSARAVSSHPDAAWSRQTERKARRADLDAALKLHQAERDLHRSLWGVGVTAEADHDDD